MRKPVMAGNWKMNKTRDEALEFIYMVNKTLPSNKDVESIIFAPNIFLRCLVKRQGEQLKIGSQNMHYAQSGAFTGETSPAMIKTTGVNHILIGHSERRKFFNETDEEVNLKVLCALNNDMIPTICCGETLEQREQNLTNEVLKNQITKALLNVSAKMVEDIIIAYEPVWAIGTGKTASSATANESCKYIRELLADLYDEKISQKIRILYGGSVTTSNVHELIAQSDIDGCLVGGASLDGNSFISLVNACL